MIRLFESTKKKIAHTIHTISVHQFQIRSLHLHTRYNNMAHNLYNRYNNMAHPEWGSVDNRLTRKTPASYRWKYFLLFFKMSRTVQRQKMADQWHCQTIETWVCSDGVYTMDQGSKQRPSPRSLSQAFMQVWISIFGGIILFFFILFFGWVLMAKLQCEIELPCWRSLDRSASILGSGLILATGVSRNDISEFGNGNGNG